MLKKKIAKKTSEKNVKKISHISIIPILQSSPVFIKKNQSFIHFDIADHIKVLLHFLIAISRLSFK